MTIYVYQLGTNHAFDGVAFVESSLRRDDVLDALAAYGRAVGDEGSCIGVFEVLEWRNGSRVPLSSFLLEASEDADEWRAFLDACPRAVIEACMPAWAHVDWPHVAETAREALSARTLAAREAAAAAPTLPEIAILDDDEED